MKKYPSCPVEIGLFCSKHGAVHKMNYTKSLSGQAKANVLENYEAEIWINLMNHGDYAEIGKLVIEKLLKAKSGQKYLARNIIISGS